ncbi:hypothetical protein BYT27DRAFT_7241362 [Phlegmacium glaucopus]|nr:hypothetical protein BYT27DRAFT_7241362 [Phlegmacium glaucopus]
MLFIPSFVLFISFLAQVTVLAVPVQLHGLSIYGRAPSLDDGTSQMLVTRDPGDPVHAKPAPRPLPPVPVHGNPLVVPSPPLVAPQPLHPPQAASNIYNYKEPKPRKPLVRGGQNRPRPNPLRTHTK